VDTWPSSAATLAVLLGLLVVATACSSPGGHGSLPATDDDSSTDDDDNDDASPGDDDSAGATCPSVYNEYYVTCGLVIDDAGGKPISEATIVLACESDQPCFELSGAIANCIIDDAGECSTMAACVAAASPCDDDDDTAADDDDNDDNDDDNGTWSIGSTLPNTEMFGVWGADATSAFVVGGTVDSNGHPVAGKAVWFFNNGAWTGNYWTYSVPVQLFGIWGADASDVWAVGEQFTSGTSTVTDTIIVTPNNGGYNYWAGTSQLYSVSGVFAGVYAVGYDFANGTSVMWNYADGSWSAMTNGAGLNPELFGVWAADSADVYAVGWSPNFQSAYLMKSNGGDWYPNQQSNDAEQWYAIWGSSGSNIFIAGAYDESGNRPVPIIWNYDGVSTFTLIQAPGTGSLYGCWGSSPTNVYFVGQDNTGAAVVLNYDGSAVSAATLPSGLSSTRLNGVWGSSPSDVYAVGYDDTTYTGVVLHYGS